MQLLLRRLVLDGDSVEIGPLAGTLIACEQPLMDANHAFLAALEAADSIELPDDRLVLTGPDDVRPAFDALDRYQALVGDWDVVNLATPNAVTGPIDGTEPHGRVRRRRYRLGHHRLQPGQRRLAARGRRPQHRPDGLDPAGLRVPEGSWDQEAASSALDETAQMSVAGATLTLLREDGTITPRPHCGELSAGAPGPARPRRRGPPPATRPAAATTRLRRPRQGRWPRRWTGAGPSARWRVRGDHGLVICVAWIGPSPDPGGRRSGG